MLDLGGWFFIVTTFGVIGAIATGLYFYPLHRAIREKRTRCAVILLSIPLVLLIAFVVYVRRESQEELRGIFGIDTKLEGKLFSLTSEGWIPDGCSIAVYDLPTEVERLFRSTPGEALSYVPQNRSFGGNGIMEPWRATPVLAGQHDYLDFVTRLSWWTDTSAVTRVIYDLKQVLREPGGYYCMRRVGDTSRVTAVDLYVVDLVHKRLYHAQADI